MLSSVLSIGRAYSYLINFIKDLYSTIQMSGIVLYKSFILFVWHLVLLSCEKNDIRFQKLIRTCVMYAKIR